MNTTLGKFFWLLAAIVNGVFCASYLPVTNKDLLGWLIAAFTSFGGLLLAVMTLAGHSLTLLQDEDWKSLQFFKNTHTTRINFSALLSFLLLLTVFILIMSYLFSCKYLQYSAGFLSGMSFIYILLLPFYLARMYIEYYDYIMMRQKNRPQRTIKKHHG